MVAWYETLRCADGITRIRETHVSRHVRCNMWLVGGRYRHVLVDAGFGFRPLADEVVELTERPVLAVASHTHFDHIGGLHQFADRLVHPAEAHVLVAADDDATVWTPYRDDPLFPDLSDDERASVAIDQSTWHVVPAPATRSIDEGDVLDLGDRVLEVLHLPGHSPGSVALYEAATRTMFTGDVIYDGQLFDHLYHSDRERYVESLARLREHPAEVFHCGHEESFGRDRLHEIIDDYLLGRMPRSG